MVKKRLVGKEWNLMVGGWNSPNSLEMNQVLYTLKYKTMGTSQSHIYGKTFM
jgi:hypothetical protein